MTGVEREVVLPADGRERYLGMTSAAIQERIEREGAGVTRRRLDDGTRVLFLYARDVAGLLKLVESFELEPKP